MYRLYMSVPTHSPGVLGVLHRGYGCRLVRIFDSFKTQFREIKSAQPPVRYWPRNVAVAVGGWGWLSHQCGFYTINICSSFKRSVPHESSSWGEQSKKRTKENGPEKAEIVSPALPPRRSTCPISGMHGPIHPKGALFCSYNSHLSNASFV